MPGNTVVVNVLSNLWSGLRASLGFRLKNVAWRPHAGAYLVVPLVCLALLAWADFRAAGGDARFNPYAVVSLAALTFCILATAILLSALQSAYDRLPVLLTAIACVLFWYLLFTTGLAHLAPDIMDDGTGWLSLWWALYLAGLGLAVVKTTYDKPRWRSYLLVLFSLAGISGVAQSWYVSSEIFYTYSDEDYQRYFDVDAEAIFHRQPFLLQHKLEPLAVGDPDSAELYFVGFAGNGDETVFRSEVEYVRDVVEQRYLAGPAHAVHLASDFDALEREPLANVYNLAQLLEGVSQRMNVADDVLMLFLTSHGSRDGSIDVSLTPLELRALDAVTLRESLDEAGIQWRIVIVSACFSGSFIDALRNDNTIIVTAASAEKTSFGCSSDRELTYFGEALFRDALAQEYDFLQAVETAKRLVTQRELEEELEPSEPQLIVGAGMLRKLQSMGLTAH